jgi:hypothetical protein
MRGLKRPAPIAIPAIFILGASGIDVLTGINGGAIRAGAQASRSQAGP